MGQQPHHRIALTVDAQRTFVRDDLASPLLFEGRGLPVGIIYTHQGQSIRHTVSVAYHKSDGSRPAFDRAFQLVESQLKYSLFDARYSVFRRLTLVHSAVQLMAGVRLKSTVNIRKYLYAPDRSEILWDGVSALEAGVHAGMRVSDDVRFAIEGHSPLVAYVNRPPFSIEGDPIFKALFERERFLRFGQVVSLNDYRGFTGTARFDWAVSSSYGMHVGYRFEFYRLNGLKAMRTLFRAFLFGFYVDV